MVPLECVLAGHIWTWWESESPSSVPGSGCRPWPLWALWANHILPPCLLSTPRCLHSQERKPACKLTEILGVSARSTIGMKTKCTVHSTYWPRSWGWREVQQDSNMQKSFWQDKGNIDLNFFFLLFQFVVGDSGSNGFKIQKGIYRTDVKRYFTVI